MGWEVQALFVKNVLDCKITIGVIEQLPWKSYGVTLFVFLAYAEDFSRSFSNKGIFLYPWKRNHKI